MSRFVDLNSGNYMHPMTDLTIQTRGLPIVISRVYRSEQAGIAPTFGWQWNFQQELRIYGAEQLGRLWLRGAGGTAPGERIGQSLSAALRALVRD